MRDQRAHYRRNWRPLKRRLHLRFISYQKAFLLLLLLLVQLAGYITYTWYSRTLAYSKDGPATDGDGQRIVFEGETAPRNAAALGGLTTSGHTYTPAELEERNGDMDFVYTFVNGTEVNHVFRRTVVRRCIETVQKSEAAWYNTRKNDGLWCRGKELLAEAHTNADVLSLMENGNVGTPSARDRERDELRYSMRSVEQHMRWHRGRLRIVSPGHHPLWIDGARNFMSTACPSGLPDGTRGQHKRVTTVHQDVVMPYGMRLTVDSHTIEMQLFRLRNMTPIHVFFNDDYFVNSDVGVSDLLNQHGGTVVRTERSMLQKAVRADKGGSWIAGVYHTNLFNVLNLDIIPEDFLPDALLKRWEEVNYSVMQHIPLAPSDRLVHTARNYKLPDLPPKAVPQRPRFFATHAPFVYCTRMFEFLNTRFEREIARNTLLHRARKARDFFTPFVYNGFIMARPWQSSPHFLPYLAALKLSRNADNATASPPPPPLPLHVELDNVDACAPATLLRRPASQAIYAKFVDDLEKNKKLMESLKETKPFFFNINDGFSTENSGKQLQSFLKELFPTPMYVERPTGPDVDTKFGTVYNELMQLPIVIFASYSEAFCPLVRSLHLAMPHFNGSVVLVRDASTAEEDGKDDLADIRRRVDYRVVSGMPVTLCTFGPRVVHANIAPGESIGEAVHGALAQAEATGSMGKHVKLPEDYIGGSKVAVGALAIDARTRHALNSEEALARALEVPGQTLALEDFELEPLDDEGNSVLVLSLADAERKVVHWINGASETDLLVTFPLPSRIYEDLNAEVKWSL